MMLGEVEAAHGAEMTPVDIVGARPGRVDRPTHRDRGAGHDTPPSVESRDRGNGLTHLVYQLGGERALHGRRPGRCDQGCIGEGSVHHPDDADVHRRSEELTSELQSLMRTSYAGFCLKNTNEDE